LGWFKYIICYASISRSLPTGRAKKKKKKKKKKAKPEPTPKPPKPPKPAAAPKPPKPAAAAASDKKKRGSDDDEDDDDDGDGNDNDESGAVVESMESGRRKRKDTGSKRAPSRPWTAEEEVLCKEALSLHGRDWHKCAAHVGTRDHRAFTSHVQKYLIKLCLQAWMASSHHSPALFQLTLSSTVKAGG
jgi:hypothetical protein